MEHPINCIKWVHVDTLTANDYNPNVVLTQELRLLAFSLVRNGWIQPILTTTRGVIIDGFHRYMLAKTDKRVRGLTGGLVPVVEMELTEPERMLLTIRINRAKGNHVSIKMHEIIDRLVKEYSYDLGTIAQGIGASKEEVELLLLENVFKALDIRNHKYSHAWYPEVPSRARVKPE